MTQTTKAWMPFKHGETRLCIICGDKAKYGPLFSPKVHCSRHRLPSYDSKRESRCEYKYQRTSAEVRCVSCGLTQFIRDGTLCGDCRDFHNSKFDYSRRHHIRKALATTGLEFVQDVTPIGKYGLHHPDFVAGTGSHIIVVEVDEGQHKGYSRRCRLARMINTFHAYGGMNMTFIRHNPDLYVDNRGMVRRGCELHLAETVKALALEPPKNRLSVIYQFYDGFDGQDKVVPIKV